MTRACAIVVGFNHWYGTSYGDGRFTRDLVLSLRQYHSPIDLILIDNYSVPAYPQDVCEHIGCRCLRVEHRIGYGAALNMGLQAAMPDSYDWYICLNNDNWIDPLHPGNLALELARLDPQILYGSGENWDDQQKIMFQWSAWLVISNQILEQVGLFDEHLEAAFEDFDYEIRAQQNGHPIATARLPLTHLDAHTRREDLTYPARWEQARLFFNEKHGLSMQKWFSI